MGLMDKAKDLLNKHDDKVDQGLEKAGEAAKQRFAGHEQHIDTGVDHLQRATGQGDTTAAPADAVPETPAEGAEPAQEVPGGPQVDVPAGPGHTPPQQQ
jgi:hypothetical protein